MAKQKGTPPDVQLFRTVHYRIYKILKQNYLHEFYQKVLQIPTKIYRINSCEKGPRFNSIGDDIEDKSHRKQSTHKPVNVIDVILRKH